MISVLVPVFNEQETLPELFSRISAAAEHWGEDYEVVLVDDGSHDDSWNTIRRLHEQDSRWKALRLGRNFGQQASISAGMHVARGNCIVVMDADLQDPPEQIGRFLEKWKEGYHVVYAVRESRTGGRFKKWCYKRFYRMLARLSYIHIPLDAGDFCLMDRKVVDILNALPERNRFLRGLRSWVGFRQAGLTYDRPGRHAGQVKYTYGRLLKLAIDGITSFSAVPLRAATIIGVVTSALSFLAGVFYLLTRIFPQVFARLGFPPVPGFATLVIALFFLGGVQLVFLGILGEYLARVYDEVKARPIWTTMERLGFDEDSSPR